MRSSSLGSVVRGTPWVISPAAASRCAVHRGCSRAITALARAANATLARFEGPFSLLYLTESASGAQVVKVAGTSLLALFKGKKEKPRTVSIYALAGHHRRTHNLLFNPASGGSAAPVDLFFLRLQ